MKFLKSILCCLILIPFISCKKVKLEDERSQQLIGKWKYEYSGVVVSSSEIVNWSDNPPTQYPRKDYWIEFIEEGEICVTDIANSQVYRVINIVRLDDAFSTYGEWHNRYVYKDENKETKGFELHYFNDSIVIQKLPYDMSVHGTQYGNVFYRVE